MGARAQVPCRAVLVQPASDELVARIVGQSRDVACELKVVQAGALSCAELAAANGAQAVLRVREPAPGGAYEVVICDAAQGTEQARAVQTEHASGDALGTSAAFEAVALVVRSALVDIAAEHEAHKQEQHAIEAQRTTEAERAQQRAAQRAEQKVAAARYAEESAREAEQEAERAEAEADRRALVRTPKALFFAGAEIAAIGADTPAFDITARLLVALAPMQVGVGFGYGLPASLELDGTDLSIERHSLALIAALPMRVSLRVTLDAGLHAGVSALVRKTRASDSGVMAAPRAMLWSALLGAEVGAALRIFGSFGARAHLGLDVLPGAPSYSLEDVEPGGAAAGRTELEPPAYVQPRAGLTLFAVF